MTWRYPTSNFYNTIQYNTIREMASCELHHAKMPDQLLLYHPVIKSAMIRDINNLWKDDEWDISPTYNTLTCISGTTTMSIGFQKVKNSTVCHKLRSFHPARAIFDKDILGEAFASDAELAPHHSATTTSLSNKPAAATEKATRLWQTAWRRPSAAAESHTSNTHT